MSGAPSLSTDGFEDRATAPVLRISDLRHLVRVHLIIGHENETTSAADGARILTIKRRRDLSPDSFESYDSAMLQSDSQAFIETRPGPRETKRRAPTRSDKSQNSRKSLESVREDHVGLQSFRSMRRMEARRRKARALRDRHSQSFASLRHRPSQAKVRSTTQLRGRTTKPFA